MYLPSTALSATSNSRCRPTRPDVRLAAPTASTPSPFPRAPNRRPRPRNPRLFRESTPEARPTARAERRRRNVPASRVRSLPPAVRRIEPTSICSLPARSGLGLPSVFLLLMVPLKMAGIFVGELFLERGWVPFAEVFLFGWSM